MWGIINSVGWREVSGAHGRSLYIFNVGSAVSFRCPDPRKARKIGRAQSTAEKRRRYISNGTKRHDEQQVQPGCLSTGDNEAHERSGGQSAGDLRRKLPAEQAWWQQPEADDHLERLGKARSEGNADPAVTARAFKQGDEAHVE